jgi:multimeric flavodoxin WrbA
MTAQFAGIASHPSACRIHRACAGQREIEAPARVADAQVSKDLATMREITGGTPYGASCVTGAGSEARMPTKLELEMCRYQGEHVTRITSQLVAGARRQ